MSNQMMWSSKLHAGQLRYHDYAKLRELHRQRWQQESRRLFYLASGATPTLRQELLSGIGCSAGAPLPTRSFWTRGGRSKPSFYDNSGNESFHSDEQIHQTMQHWATQNRYDVIVQAWHKEQIKSTALAAYWYLEALPHVNNAQEFRLNKLVRRLLQSNSLPKEDLLELESSLQHLPKSEQIQKLKEFLWTTGQVGAFVEQTRSAEAMNSTQPVGMATGGSLGAARAAPIASTFMNAARSSKPNFSSPLSKNPNLLYVQVHEAPSPFGRFGAVIRFVSSLALGLLFFSAMLALLDDKGLNRAPGFGSKHVQEADEDATKRKVKFDDVKGVAEAKAELEEIVLYLKDPSRFTRLGGKLPRGLLLIGPPGTGKTLLAKAIAGEADVPFFYASGSQFEEVFVGLGAKRVRELFEAAKNKAPAIIFIDEIDAIGGTRRLKDQSALKMTLNELLVQLDGFDENNGIIVIGATNFVESLDAALMRPGRFDKHVNVPLPDVGGRKEILEMYAKKTKLASDVNLSTLARGTTGFSGADLYNLVNQAALKASIDGLDAINMAVLEYAKDKIIMGAERKSAVITPATAKCTAYHEAGHAVVAVLTDGAQPIHKATIMPRGNALGMVATLPEGDQTSMKYKEMIAAMDMAMGGRVAEELIFGKEKITSGAVSDIKYATSIARNMVTKYGFAESIGVVFHGGDTGEDSASSKTRVLIDTEVRALTDAAYKRAKDLLTKYAAEHKLLAETLLEYETLTGDEVRDVVLRRQKPKRSVINKEGGSRGDQSLFTAISGKS